MGRYHPLRIVLALLALIFVVVFPWWVALLLLVLAALRYPFYFEALVIGYIFDVWYAPAGTWYAIVFVLCVVLVVELCVRFFGLRRS